MKIRKIRSTISAVGIPFFSTKSLGKLTLIGVVALSMQNTAIAGSIPTGLNNTFIDLEKVNTLEKI